MKLLVQPTDGVAPLISAIKKAKTHIDILIFRFDIKQIESALRAASDRGVAVRALIAQTNRGGETKLRSLEMRFLEAGITVVRTASDLTRYHGKMMIVDRRTLFLLSFNFVHLDIDHSRGFGIVTANTKIVSEADKLFEADCNRTEYLPGMDELLVSPVNARAQLSAFIKNARKQLFIYDPKIADRRMIRLIEDRANEGVEVKIIGSLTPRKPNLAVSRLTTMRLHTRTIIVDGKQAFVGSQSLRQLELESRREIGMIVRDSKVVKTLLATFEKDWAATGFEETSATASTHPEAAGAGNQEAARALAREMTPLTATVKKAIKQAVSKAGVESARPADVKATLKDAVKTAVKEAVLELVAEN
jgi:phosphatidylserine/phosphatidylglycerophosphate/cardiolipin synthase-like enzyme